MRAEELYYPSSENKDGNREADLRLCFRLCRLLVFPCGGSYGSYLLGGNTSNDHDIMHQSFVTTPPPLQGWVGDTQAKVQGNF